MFILGYSLLVWLGLLTAIFIGSAVCAVYLGRRYKKILRGRWHHKLALTGVFFGVFHVVLAILQVFFNIFI